MRVIPDNATFAVIGLGYVGLPLAVEFGRHRATVGFDIDAARIDELRPAMTAPGRSPRPSLRTPHG